MKNQKKVKVSVSLPAINENTNLASYFVTPLTPLAHIISGDIAVLGKSIQDLTACLDNVRSDTKKLMSDLVQMDEVTKQVISKTVIPKKIADSIGTKQIADVIYNDDASYGSHNGAIVVDSMDNLYYSVKDSLDRDGNVRVSEIINAFSEARVLSNTLLSSLDDISKVDLSIASIVKRKEEQTQEANEMSLHTLADEIARAERSLQTLREEQKVMESKLQPKPSVKGKKKK